MIPNPLSYMSFLSLFHLHEYYSIYTSSGLDKMEGDLAIGQILSTTYACMWSFALAGPFTMVCFAYRYDASQAGHAKVEEKEADAIIEDSSITHDGVEVVTRLYFEFI